MNDAVMPIAEQSAPNDAAQNTAATGERRFVFFHNRRSGRNDADQLLATLAAALPDAADGERMVAPQPGESMLDAAERAAQLASRYGASLVVIGGDGTVNAAVQQAIAHEVPLGIIAAGTFNFVARSYGIPEDPAAAVSLLKTARAHSVQVGHVNSRVFMVNACVGLYRRVLADREVFKHRIGRHRAVAAIAAVWSALQRCEMFTFTTPDQPQLSQNRAASVLVSNNRLQLSMAGFTDAATVEHGHLLGIVFGRSTAGWRVWTLIKGALGKIEELPQIHTFSFKHFEMDLPKRRRRWIKVAIDGEITRLALPLVFQCGVGELQLICRDTMQDNDS